MQRSPSALPPLPQNTRAFSFPSQEGCREAAGWVSSCRSGRGGFKTRPYGAAGGGLGEDGGGVLGGDKEGTCRIRLSIISLRV